MFARDSYETFTGLLADGDLASARQMVRFLFDRAQQPDGSFPRDSLLNGEVAPDTYGLYEIDEDAYPLLMAWQAGFAGDKALYAAHIRPDADFIVATVRPTARIAGRSTRATRPRRSPPRSPG